MQKTYVVSFGLFFRGKRVTSARRGPDRWIFPSRETREKECFPLHYVFLPGTRRPRGDRLFFNFPFVCLSTRFKSARL
jgi:hypothetical protein